MSAANKHNGAAMLRTFQADKATLLEFARTLENAESHEQLAAGMWAVAARDHGCDMLAYATAIENAAAALAGDAVASGGDDEE